MTPKYSIVIWASANSAQKFMRIKAPAFWGLWKYISYYANLEMLNLPDCVNYYGISAV